jgi:TIR domain
MSESSKVAAAHGSPHGAGGGMKPVFVSYSSTDAAVARSVCSRLEAGGFPCWIAPRDIRPGDNWGEAIIRGLDGSWLMVVVLSPSSNESRQVEREVSRAVDRAIHVVPLRTVEFRPHGALEYFLADYQWLDAFPNLQDQLDVLAHVVGELSMQRGTAAPPAKTDQKEDPSQYEEVALDDLTRRRTGRGIWRLLDDR